MSWTWESWKIGRKLIHRDDNGKFAKNNFHAPEEWKNYGRAFTKKVRQKISNTLKGVPFTEKRKRNISKATKAANYKWAKGCKHGVIPITDCRECKNAYQRKWREENREYFNLQQREYRKKNKDHFNQNQKEYRKRKKLLNE